MKGSGAGRGRGIRRNIFGHRAILNVPGNVVVTSQYMLQSCRMGACQKSVFVLLFIFVYVIYLKFMYYIVFRI